MPNEQSDTTALTPAEKAMSWERMSGERLSDTERKRIMGGGEFTPPHLQPVKAKRYGIERSMVDDRWCVYGPRGEALCPWFLVPAMWIWVRLQ